MSYFNTVQQKLQAFITRYYYNELLKGFILFFSLGLLYFILTLFVENFLWLNSIVRAFLFWSLLILLFLLFVKFILLPISKLLKLKEGLNDVNASKIIGTYFPEVSDKLLNVLQLNQNTAQSELLVASIEQKAAQISPIPFKLAINFKSNFKYLKYALVPLLLVLLVFLSGNFSAFKDSYKRVVNYNIAYLPPAPFNFVIENSSLNAIENTSFKLYVKTVGKILPEAVQIKYNNETYFLQQNDFGSFEYDFKNVTQAIHFELFANNIYSQPYTIDVLNVPSILNMQLFLRYPSYTQLKDNVIENTGSTTVPEGTTVVWKVTTKNTNEVDFIINDTLPFIEKDHIFNFSKRISDNLNYTISSSNLKVKHYENLNYTINVVKDEFPELTVKMKLDSLDQETLYFYGQATDDYGLSKLQLKYYESEHPSEVLATQLPIEKSTFNEFFASFPNQLAIKPGVQYQLYFEVFDNDSNHNYKSVKSQEFSFRKRTVEEDNNRDLNTQKETISSFSKSLNKFEEQTKELKSFSDSQKEKDQLNFNDKKKLQSFIDRQKQQDEMMNNFNNQFKQNIDKSKTESKFKEKLKERIAENETKLKQDEKLLDELQKLQDSLSNEKLSEKLDNLSKQNKVKQRSLKQLLELTKRFYLQEKVAIVQDKLQKLAEKQESLSNKSDKENTKDNQEKINKDYDQLVKDLEQLQKQSKELQKPIDIPIDKLKKEELEKDLKEAAEQLEKSETNQKANSQNSDDSNSDKAKDKAKQKQKQAADKMEEMSKGLQQASQQDNSESVKEDADMLRQILDNVLVFSFDQEELLKTFSTIQDDHNKYAQLLKQQYNLKEHFEHIDDSIFALSLRQPTISQKVNQTILDVFYNIDNAISTLSQAQVSQGNRYQQYALTAANNLANMLSDVENDMQMQMQNAGRKPGPGMQLQDIIMSQDEINQQMQEGTPQDKSDNPQKSGDSANPNENSKEKHSTKDGKKQAGEQSGDQNDGFSDDVNGELFKIFQQQQELRNTLEKQIGNGPNANKAKPLLNAMEQIETDLLNKGFNKQTYNKMLDLKHQLLKLDNAFFQQGEEERREAKTNLNDFQNTTNNKLPLLKQYFNSTEILNKQALPLQTEYKQRVQNYFKQSND